MVERSTKHGGIFSSESSVTAGHKPIEPVNRTQERSRIMTAVQPLRQGDPPEHVFLYGPAGTGKTTVAKHVLQTLAEESRVATAYINCWQYDTRPSLLPELLRQLGYPQPRKGKPVDALLTKLHEWVTKNRCVAVVLDEFDRQRAQTEIVYDLYAVSEGADHEIGMMLISNKAPTELHLDSRSQSRLNFRPVHFDRYDADDLYAILQARATTMFRADVIADEVLSQIADYIAGMNGDCRRAIELLHRAGRIAQREQADAVIVDHVKQSIHIDQNDGVERSAS
jgi:cell division control protein 6